MIYEFNLLGTQVCLGLDSGVLCCGTISIGSSTIQGSMGNDLRITHSASKLGIARVYAVWRILFHSRVRFNRCLGIPVSSHVVFSRLLVAMHVST